MQTLPYPCGNPHNFSIWTVPQGWSGDLQTNTHENSNYLPPTYSQAMIQSEKSDDNEADLPPPFPNVF
jgi:hypothetical protein